MFEVAAGSDWKLGGGVILFSNIAPICASLGAFQTFRTAEQPLAVRRLLASGAVYFTASDAQTTRFFPQGTRRAPIVPRAYSVRAQGARLRVFCIGAPSCKGMMYNGALYLFVYFRCT